MAYEEYVESCVARTLTYVSKEVDILLFVPPRQFDEFLSQLRGRVLKVANHYAKECGDKNQFYQRLGTELMKLSAILHGGALSSTTSELESLARGLR